MSLATVFLLNIAVVLSMDFGDWGEGDVHVDFEPKRGFISTWPFTLTLTNPPGFTDIRYVMVTGDNTPPVAQTPSSTVGTIYSGPIQVTQHCVIQAIGYNSTKTTNITTHSFFNYNTVISQPGLLSYVTGNVAYSSKFVDGLKALPAMSIRCVTPYDQTYQVAHGKAPIIPAHAEYLPNNGKEGWSAPVGEENSGALSLSYPKHSIRIRFDEDWSYNQNKLQYNMFGDVDIFPNTTSSKGIKYSILSMRSGSQDSIFAADRNFNGAYGTSALYMKNNWFSLYALEQGYFTAKFRMVHIYWNGKYQGVNTLLEKPGAGLLASYFGTTSDNFEGIAASRPTGTNGDLGWKKVIADKGSWALDGPRVETNHVIDYLLTGLYSADIPDVSQTYNWQSCGPTLQVLDQKYLGQNFLGPEDYGWKFWHNDEDFSFLIPYVNSQQFTDAVQNLPLALFNEKHVDFLMAFIDRVHYLFVNPEGALVPTKVRERFEKLRSFFKLDVALIPESARWGNYGPGGAWTVDAWKLDVDKIYTQFVDVRTAKVITFLNSQDARIMAINQPVLSLSGKTSVPVGTTLTITVGAGCELHYTTNGEDPRLKGGAQNPNSTKVPALTTTITLTTSTIVKARCFKSPSTWGPINQPYFQIVDTDKCELCGNIIPTEIHFRPRKVKALRTSTELSIFVELKNIGNTTLDLCGAYFESFDFKFKSVKLAPGDFYVITRSWQDFVDTYNQAPNGRFFGYLEKKDKLTLLDASGRTVFKINYKNEIPWSELADGKGYSLVPRNYTKDLTNPKNWRTSTNPNGSPGADDPAMPDSRVIKLIINEVYSSENPGESYVELFNPTATDVNIYGWDIRESYDIDGKHLRLKQPQDKTTAIVPANGYKSFMLQFPLNNSIEQTIVLFGAEYPAVDPDEVPRSNMEFISEDVSETIPGYPRGVWKTSTGESVFTTLESQTKDAINSKPYLSDVIISAVGYQKPSSGFYISTQYIELTNIGQVSVDISRWSVGVGSKSAQKPFSIPDGTSLVAGQKLYLINTTISAANFRIEYDIPANALILSNFNASTLEDKISLRQYVAAGDYTANVDHVSVDRFVPTLQLDYPAVNPASPKRLQRILAANPVAGFAMDIASWKISSIDLRPKFPTVAPTREPTVAPTRQPTEAPTVAPTNAPTPPTNAPTNAPTPPTNAPTEAPTNAPTPPTNAPTEAPTKQPTAEPTSAPTNAPTPPTNAPTPAPTRAPTPPTKAPTAVPTTAAPTNEPTPPTEPPPPTTVVPTETPTEAPTDAPTGVPTGETAPPTDAPTPEPTPEIPTDSPAPTAPTDTPAPTEPTEAPTSTPTDVPTLPPTRRFNPFNVTWGDPKKHTMQEVANLIKGSPLRPTTRYILVDPLGNEGSFKRSTTQTGDVWKASITDTDMDTTTQAEAEVLANWLRNQEGVNGVRVDSASRGSSGLSTLALVGIILGSIVGFLIILLIIVLAFGIVSSKNSSSGRVENYELL